MAALYCAAFWPLHVPYWYIIGILGGVSAVIPRIGALIPIGLAVIALDVRDAPLRNYVFALLAWILVQFIEFFFLLPRLISRPLGLKELPVLAALLLGSLVFGPLGLVFAVPVLAIGLVFWRHFRKRST